MKETNEAILTGLKLSGVTAKYDYTSDNAYASPTVDDSKYIIVSYTQGKTDDTAISDCKTRFAGDSNINDVHPTKYGKANDSRLNFPGILV